MNLPNKLCEEKNFIKMILVLHNLTLAIDPHVELVEMCNRVHPIFTQNRQISTSTDQIANTSKHAELDEGGRPPEKGEEILNAKSPDHVNRYDLIYSQLAFLKHKVPHKAFVMALLYIDRATKEKETLLLNSQNFLKIVLAAVMIAAKFIEEETHSKYKLKHSQKELNSHHRHTLKNVIGISDYKQLRIIELQMLQLMDYNAFISKDQYDKYQKELNQMFEVELSQLEEMYQNKNKSKRFQ